jgi:hypothetical protein
MFFSGVESGQMLKGPRFLYSATLQIRFFILPLDGVSRNAQ